MEKNVECYSGAEYAEQPRKFLWQGTWRTVDRIYAQRRTIEGKQFEVVDDAEEKFLLSYAALTDRWTIQSFR
ncbi:MAG: hypothetical protein A3K46_06915 [Chloroflexi bacterium RBG_13_60_9]|nr:MAG: hypothetical protein A3K46_06915 [Chloroflexi bacterium RBG_13_60_9]